MHGISHCAQFIKLHIIQLLLFFYSQSHDLGVKRISVSVGSFVYEKTYITSSYIQKWHDVHLLHFIFIASDKEMLLSASGRERAQKVNFTMLTKMEKCDRSPQLQLFYFINDPSQVFVVLRQAWHLDHSRSGKQFVSKTKHSWQTIFIKS